MSKTSKANKTYFDGDRDVKIEIPVKFGLWLDVVDKLICWIINCSFIFQPPPSGMEILIQFIQDNRLRLKDLFFQFDKDQSGDISREEFKVGLKETGIEMSEVR